MWYCQSVLGETSSPASTIARSKHSSSSSDRKSSSHAAVPAVTSRSSTVGGKPSISAAPVDQSSPGVGKAKNVCIVEPQSTSKATAVVAPLVPESRQFADLFGEPIVKSDTSKKHHYHHKVTTTRLFLVIYRVCADPGKSWKSWNMKFKFFRPGKSWKVMENIPNGCRISDWCTFSAFYHCPLSDSVRSVV